MRGLTLPYLTRRFFLFFVTIWVGATLIFIIPRLSPSDPTSAMIARLEAQSGPVKNGAELIAGWRARFGLDKPIGEQYVTYITNLMRLDFGYSLTHFPTSANQMIAQSLPWTVGLVGLATVFSCVIGSIIGALLAWRGTPGLMRALLPLSLIFTAIPFLMMAMLLLYVFVFNLQLFPIVGGYGREVTPGFNAEFILSVIHSGTLPALAIIITSMGFWALGMRGMLITIDGEDYVLLARAKGLRAARVFWQYGIRNALLPQVTALALALGGIIGGNILVEYIFGYPGLGYLLYQSIINSDYTVIQGVVFLLILLTALAILLLDLIYPLLDPRITYKKS